MKEVNVMAISEVIRCEIRPNTPAPEDYLVVEHWGENYTTTSQLIVDETHQAVLVVNGQAADLFGAGAHTLSTPNIPILNKIINIPTGGEDPFTCKVFYITQVHQMDMLWGTQGAITLNDPLYDIFLHVMLHGSLSFSIADSRKFLIKLAGFRNFTNQQLLNSFRGLVSSHVKDAISQIMIREQQSYFMVNANLFETSQKVKARLDNVFDEYGIRIEFFNIESVEVPQDDYEAVTKAKERRTGRAIEGYTWKEEQEMKVAQTFAANEGTLGGMAGVIGGIAGGVTMGNVTGNMVGNAFQTVPTGGASYAPNPSYAAPQPQAPAMGGVSCGGCGQPLPEGSKFCPACGTPAPQQSAFCPQCGQPAIPGSKFCNQCGFKF